MTAEDVYFKKVVTLRYRDQLLRFRVAQELFSSHEVDVGSQRLLRTLSDAGGDNIRAILDLGCGYGPIGLALKKAEPERIVHMVDRDALALEYARQNAELNELAGVETYGSLGYADVVSAIGFDLIVSNIPGKAGERAIASFLRGAARYLSPRGFVAIVVVRPLEAMVSSMLTEPTIELLLQKAWSGHTVFHYRFRGQDMPRPQATYIADGVDVYEHERIDLAFHDLEVSVRTVRTLPEFDMLHDQTVLLLEHLARLGEIPKGRALFFNPGQGHIAAILWRLLAPDEIALVDRDLLSLRVARGNLVLNGCPSERVSLAHQVGLLVPGVEPVDLVVGILREDEGPAVHAQLIRQAVEQLSPDGTIIVAASSTVITRLETTVRVHKWLTVRERKRRKGRGILILRRN